jgi:hypothetical protein
MDRKMMGWLALDLVGTLVFVAGAIGLFGDGSLLPDAWRFPGHNVILILIGLAMMYPYMVYVIRKGRQRQQSG